MRLILTAASGTQIFDRIDARLLAGLEEFRDGRDFEFTHDPRSVNPHSFLGNSQDVREKARDKI